MISMATPAIAVEALASLGSMQLHAATLSVAAHLFPNPRHLSQHAAPRSGGGGDASPSAPSHARNHSWWSSLRSALFPVTDSSASSSSGGSTTARTGATPSTTSAAPKPPLALASTAAMQRLQRTREAAQRQQDATASDVFIPLSADAQNFSGLLFKVSIAMITIPLAMWFISSQLLLTLCINGLRSPDPHLIKMSLGRVQYYIFNETLASWFERDDGVVMLVSLLGNQAVLSDKAVMLECLATIQHLMQYEETRVALLLGMVTERLKRALDNGWVAPGAVPEARSVYQSLADIKRQQMEDTFGRTEGAAAR